MLKKLITLFLCFIILVSVCACNKTDEKAVTMESSIATLDNESIDEAYFKFYFTEWKKQMQYQYGEVAWQNATFEGKSALDYVRDRALQLAVEDKITMLKAKEDGIALTDDDMSEIASTKKQWIDFYGGEKKFTDGIKNDYGLSVEQFDIMFEAYCYKKHLIKKYVTDDKILDYYNSNIVKVKHILIPTVELNSNIPLTADELQASKEKVELVLSEISKGADFDSLVAEYTSDQDTFYYVGTGYSLNIDGSMGGGMVEEFETASFALNVGQISGVVESTYGYHIIKRYENDEAMYNIAKDTMATILFTDIMEEWKSQKNLVINNDVYNSYK